MIMGISFRSHQSIKKSTVSGKVPCSDYERKSQPKKITKECTFSMCERRRIVSGQE
jgi:hypothetical protein